MYDKKQFSVLKENIGRRFERLTVLAIAWNERVGWQYKVACDCGLIFKRKVKDVERSVSCGGCDRKFKKKPSKRRLNKDGYVIITHKGKEQFEHRVIYEQETGYKLESFEEVHHKNGNRSDNRVQNLELWAVGKQPRGQRVLDLIENAVWVLSRYKPELLKTAVSDRRRIEVDLF